MNADGTTERQVTKLGGANFCAVLFPGRQADYLRVEHATTRAGATSTSYSINVDGTGLERVTFNESFDGFPMFSPDGKKLVFASNRFQKASGETNVFIADWSW